MWQRNANRLLPTSRGAVAVWLVAVLFRVALMPCAMAAEGTHSTPPLNSRLPFDVNVTRVRHLVAQGKFAAAHAEFDHFAWQAFIALNWPAQAEGRPSTIKTISDLSAPRVWDFWRPADTIFLGQGAAPSPWVAERQESSHYNWKSAWRQHTTAASSLQAFSGPLVDLNGHWVRYQIRVNKPEFDYIRDNGLYSLDGQVAFSQRETHNQVELPLNIGTKRHGAIEIKLAWKELGPGDDPKRFYTRELTSEVSEPPDANGQPRPAPPPFKAGLVGMHISLRTESSPEWIWATFEQIDNVRSNHAADGHATHPNFYDPASLQPVNQLPTANAVQNPDTGVFTIVTDPKVKADKWVESLTKTPVQVARIEVPTQPGLNPLDHSLHEVTQAINVEIQRRLGDAGSVFQYYELIDTQWPLHPNAPAAAGGAGTAPESITHKTPGDMVPVFLVNTIMETYFQHGEQSAGALEQDDRLASDAPTIDATPIEATESCVGCHYSSGIAIGFKKDLTTGRTIVDKRGVPMAVFGENNHFGKTGNASFSWMLQLEPKVKPRDPQDPHVIVQE
jgi:hypothetical protein